MRPAQTSSDRPRGRVVRVTALFGAVVLVMCASLGGYLASREYTAQPSVVFGLDQENPNRVDVTAWVSKVDVTAQAITVLLVDVKPTGSYALEDGSFAQDATLATNSLQNAAHAVRRGEDFPSAEGRFSLAGVVTDFPFDGYASDLSFRMTRADGTAIPLAVTLTSTDAFFSAAPTYDAEQSDWLNVDIGIHRSLPTVVFGVFVMILMLGLSFAAALSAYFLVRTRQGVVFGAYSVMAALLFAMIPLRNAVPGSPPIGSVIDFVSFFIAETVISVSLITSVVIGYRHQLEIDRDAAGEVLGRDTNGPLTQGNQGDATPRRQ